MMMVMVMSTVIDDVDDDDIRHYEGISEILTDAAEGGLLCTTSAPKFLSA